MLKTLCRHRRALHQIPEIGYELEKTQKYLISVLKTLPVTIETVSPSGIFAYLDFGKPETIAFRADMDALPMDEKTGCTYSSLHPGKMHACGHDGHMALLLTLIETLCKRQTSHKNALFIFQPAEEAGNGAKRMLEAGVLQKHNVRAIYACHVEPSLPKGVIACRPGPFMARSCEVHVFGYGKSAHIAHAQEGIDALEMSARFYLRAMEHIESAYKNDMHLFRFGRFVSGTANNVLSAKTVIDGSLRAFDDRVFFQMRNDLQAIARETEREFGGRIDVQTDEGYPPLINSPDCFESIRKAAAGENFLEMPLPHMTAEDFSCYLSVIPGAMFNVGLGVDSELHACDFNFEEDALLPALNVFLNLFDQ